MDRLERHDRANDGRTRTGAGPVAGITPLPGTGHLVSTWNYRPDAGWSPEHNLVGYRVEAIDGKLGKIDQVGQATNESYLVANLGMFGGKVMIPAGSVSFIDHGERRIYLDRTRAEVKGAPDFDPRRYAEPDYRRQLESYYALTYRGIRVM